LTTSNPTGWATGDQLVFAPTTSSIATRDERTISTISGTTLTIPALTNAKTLFGGAQPVECEIINLTRNIRIFATSTAFWSQLLVTLTGVHEAYYTEFFRVSANHNSSTVGTSFYHYGCSVWSLGTASNGHNNASGVRSFTCENSVIYDVSAAVGFGSHGNVSGGPNMQFIDVIAMFGRSGSQGIISNSSGGIYCTRVRAIGGGNTNFSFGNNSQFTIPTYIKDCVSKSGSVGLQLSIAYANNNAVLALVENIRCYLNTGSGITAVTPGWIIDTANLYSNVTNISCASTDILFRNITMNAGPTNSSTVGVAFAFTGASGLKFQNCTMGVTTPHSTSDIRITAIATTYPNIQADFVNCTFASTSEIALQTSNNGVGKITSARHDQTDGVHKTWYGNGTLTSDSVIYDTTTPGTKSTRLTPLVAALKLQSAPKSVAVKDGAFVTVSVKVRCSVIGDGVVYNGNRPRLVLAVNTASHIETVDTVLATATAAANGAFQTLTATIPTAAIDNAGISFFVDCDGTAGFVSVDSWRFS